MHLLWTGSHDVGKVSAAPSLDTLSCVGAAWGHVASSAVSIVCRRHTLRRPLRHRSSRVQLGEGSSDREGPCSSAVCGALARVRHQQAGVCAGLPHSACCETCAASRAVNRIIELSSVFFVVSCFRCAADDGGGALGGHRLCAALGNVVVCIRMHRVHSWPLTAL